MKTFKQYRDLAALSLGENMGPIVLGTLVFVLISDVPGLLLTILICMPVAFCYSVAFLHFVRKDEPQDFFERMFACFSNGKYTRSLGVYLLTTVYTALWTLLFIIPGIVKSYSYAMTYYIAEDHPEYSADRCIHESRMMMRGYKGKLFLLDLSYIGWLILSCFTFGILLLWVKPKMEFAHAHFYQDLLAERGTETPQDTEETPRFAE